MSLTNATSQNSSPDGFEGFRKGLLQFQSILTPAQHAAIQNTSLSDLQKAIKDIQTKQFASKTYRYLSRIDPFVQGVIDCGKVIEVFGNTSPMLAYVWGPMKFLLQTASNAIKVFEKLLDSYESIAERLPQFEKYIDVFPESLSIRQIISAILEDILKFHKYAMKIFTRRASSWRLIFESTWNGLKEPLDFILEDLRRHQGLLMEEGLLAHYNETRIHWDEELSERKNQRKQEHYRLKEDIRRWAAPTDFQFEHDRQREIIKDYVHTGRWLVTKPAFLDWVDSTSYKTLFWLYGIPGSGKTVLASHVIEHLKAAKPATSTNPPGSTPSLTIAYFYCREDSIQPATYDSIIRTLIWQLIHQNPDIMHYFDSERSGYTQVPLRRVEDLQELFRKVITVLENIYIVVDGVDEIEPNQRGYLLETFLNIDQTHNLHRASKIKFFLSSQVSVDIRYILAKFENRIGCPILITDSRDDIQNYIRSQSLRIRNKFDLSEDEANQIIAAVSNNVERLFLLAKLVMENLFAQLNIEDLQEELLPKNLPQELFQAYERIRLRNSKNFSEREAKGANRIFLLITYARTPLKVWEINGALSINAGDSTIDFRKRRLRPNATSQVERLCGTIIEIIPNSSIHFVHPTARQYYIEHLRTQTQSDPECYFAEVCLIYLASSLFESEEPSDTAICNGDYSFSEYALRNLGWHLREIDAKKISSNSLGQLVNRWMNLVESQFSSLIGFNSITLAHANTLDLSKSFETMKEEVLALEDACKGRLSKIRMSIENCITRNTVSAEVLTEAYGKTPFKCKFIECPKEFRNAKERDEHVSKHELPFKCEQQDCIYASIGFSTKGGLAEHIRKRHTSQSPRFPQITNKNLTIWDAVKMGNISLVKRLLDETPTLINAMESRKKKTRPIHIATKMGRIDMIKLLLDHGADAHQQPGDTQHTPLFDACRSKNTGIPDLILDRIPEHTRAEECTLTFYRIIASHPANFLALDYLIRNGADIDQQQQSRGVQSNPLHKAIEHRSLPLVKYLVGHKANLETIKRGSGTAIQDACAQNDTDIIKYLIDSGADTDPRNGLSTPLQHACKHGNIGVVKYLVNHGATASQQDNDYSLLMDTIRAGKSHIASLLINHGAGADLSVTKMTPLQYACDKESDLDTVIFLISQGADVNARNDYRTPLQYACIRSRRDMIKYLVNHGAEINIQNVYPTPLQIACRDGSRSRDIIEYLVGHGAEINTQNGGWTPLQAACKYGSRENIEYLVDHGAEINTQNGDLTPLQHACGNKSLDVVGYLIDRGADANPKTNNNESPLTIACRSKSLDTVMYLVDHGADINTRSDNRHKSPLHTACEYGKLEISKYLIDHGADIDRIHDIHGTALQAACDGGNLGIVKSLIARGAAINAHGGYRGSALEAACFKGYIDIVRYLIDYGADVNFTGRGGGYYSPLAIARREKHFDLAQYLVSQGAIEPPKKASRS